jgi:hypothetical protein
MNPLIAALRSARERWVDVAPGKDVKIRRPTEAEFPAFLKEVDGRRSLSVELSHVQQFVVDWRGFTEADLLGATVGVADAVPFDPEVWAEVVADHLEWLKPAANALLLCITEHVERDADAAKNSVATSTAGPVVAMTTDSTATTTP